MPNIWCKKSKLRAHFGCFLRSGWYNWTNSVCIVAPWDTSLVYPQHIILKTLKFHFSYVGLNPLWGITKNIFNYKIYFPIISYTLITTLLAGIIFRHEGGICTHYSPKAYTLGWDKIRSIYIPSIMIWFCSAVCLSICLLWWISSSEFDHLREVALLLCWLYNN